MQNICFEKYNSTHFFLYNVKIVEYENGRRIRNVSVCVVLGILKIRVRTVQLETV